MREPNQHPGRPADPCAMVIWSASGDLTKRKLIPALYNLANDHLLSSEFAIVGFARNDLDTGAFRGQLAEDIKTFATGSVDAEIWEWLLGRIYYVPGDFKDPKAYQKLKEVIAQEIHSNSAHGNVLYYLATAPSLFAEIVQQIGSAGLAHEEDGRWRRVIIDGVLEPMELAHLPYKNGRTYEEYIGVRGFKRFGKKKWRRHVVKAAETLRHALQVDSVVLGGGNVKQLKKVSAGIRLGSNAHACLGGYRLWKN